ncbi:hypothetical protein AMJ82_08955 [candidate division TA06 bacterium SM23_40]|uniref:Uncharacterized protein n=1 Tax=candidate division TA06 bacterium SM23_40 TaxID=1703774 RepID=A0A0S8G5H2_UNCT6|nr:MAG: hypothetical protein AMJ82_08955 [candidate division TA06 bacterium SM23_40]
MRSYLGYQQRQDLEGDKEYFENQLKNPLVQDKPTVRRNLQRIERDLETQSPPILSGPDLDKVVTREKELREEIVPNMLSQEEMRKAPAGSIGREMAFQKKYKRKIIEWKNCRRTIYRESDDPDVANLECFRPEISRGNVENCLIPGQKFDFPSRRFQENYPTIDWSNHDRPEDQEAETEASKLRRMKLAELRAQMAELEAEEEAEATDSISRLGLEEEEA